MSEDGSLWITIDDNEAHYLKVLCDEVFGRANFVATCVWEKRNFAEKIAVLFRLIMTICSFTERIETEFDKDAKPSLD